MDWQRVDDESFSSENSLSDNSTDYGEDTNSSTDGGTSISDMVGASFYQLGKLLWKNGGEEFI
jgi:FlaG/FlaF family flagellin (archaellin)